jgi:hypothetical protein
LAKINFATYSLKGLDTKQGLLCWHYGERREAGPSGAAMWQSQSFFSDEFVLATNFSVYL